VEAKELEPCSSSECSPDIYLISTAKRKMGGISVGVKPSPVILYYISNCPKSQVNKQPQNLRSGLTIEIDLVPSRS
jgi:hypothetical protein